MAIYHALSDDTGVPWPDLPGLDNGKNYYQSYEDAKKAAQGLLAFGTLDRIMIIRVTTQGQGYAYPKLD